VFRPEANGEAKVPDFTQKDLRNALGRFATGVTVVTTMTPAGPLGITVNSFSSVSLDPPLVLWSPARKSTRFPAFEASTHFAIHVLATDQQPLAEHFARHGVFPSLPFTPGLGDAPLLDGAVTRLECLHAVHYDGGDHLIVVGEVLRIAESERPPLLYYRGAYHPFGA
jgi:flavin reductase (DIM6/NTAB) family NADH-FMN oxidoreductase RutF